VPAREQQHIAALSTLLKEAIDLAGRRDALPANDYARHVEAIEDRLDAWLEANLDRGRCSPELDRLDTHIRSHRGEWLVFLHEPAVAPTNNHAEQMLRPSVITRKVGGCNKNLLGALVHSILSSLMVTCHRQGKRFLDLARNLWQNDKPMPVPIASLPNAGSVVPPKPIT
jgi:hypothetical protein